MQIVIDIDDELYKYAQDKEIVNNSVLSFSDRFILLLKDGTPLPKGHGRLIDADDVYDVLSCWECEHQWIWDKLNDKVPTVLEADMRGDTE